VVEALFKQFDGYLARRGYIARGGQILDNSIVPVQRNQNKRDQSKAIKNGEVPEGWAEKPAMRSQKDTDPRWTRKHGKSYYGYKKHVNVDRQLPVRGANRPFPAACAIADAHRRKKCLFNSKNQATLTQRRRSLGECLVKAGEIPSHRKWEMALKLELDINHLSDGWHEAGEVSIETGTIMIVDPCFVDQVGSIREKVNDLFVEFSDSLFQKGLIYNGTTLEEIRKIASEHDHLRVRFGETVIDGGRAVLSSMGLGDGQYPVYASVEYDSDWETFRVVGLWIDFLCGQHVSDKE
jgi:hypothetical protein